MRRKETVGKVLSLSLNILLFTFIFSNSLRNGEQSSGQSDAVLAMVNRVLGEFSSLRAGSGLIRKAAHFTEFAALGASLALALRWWRPAAGARGWFGIALAIGVAGGAMDEFLQLFSPGRAARIADVLLDSAGVLAGALTMTGLLCWVALHRARG